MEIGDILLATPKGIKPTVENLKKYGVKGIMLMRFGDGSVYLRVGERTLVCYSPRPPIYLGIDDLPANEQFEMSRIRWSMIADRAPKPERRQVSSESATYRRVRRR